MNDLINLLRTSMKDEAALDAATTKKQLEGKGAELSASVAFREDKLKRDALDVLWDWAVNDTELDEDESSAERLQALIIGLADEDKDGTISDVEQHIIDMARDTMASFMEALGADEGDCMDLLEGQDEDAAERVRDLLLGELEDDDAASEAFDAFVFGDEDEEEDEDEGETFDRATPIPARSKQVYQGRKASAVRKKFVAFKNGIKTVRWKRIAGRVKLTAAQKKQLAAARKLAHTGAAKAKWAKSMKARREAGIKNNQQA